MIGLYALAKDPPVDVSAHLADATTSLWILLAATLLWVVVRFDLWRRLWLTTTDPRPVALFRILIGIVALWSVLDMLPYLTLLFTDEGLFPPHVARMRFARDLAHHWNPEHGFEHLYDWYHAIAGRASLLHLGNPPELVYTVFGATIVAAILMILGLWTRISTLCCWFGVHTLFLYAPLWHAGGDTVLRIFLLLGLCSRWGEAYSLDRVRRIRTTLRAPTATSFPALRAIPAWPVHMMLVQLTVIYVTTGAVKTGIAWRDGTALYYSTSLAHFYRFPEQVTVVSYLQGIGLLPLMTWLVRLWEVGFVLALVGVVLRGYERAQAHQQWPQLARWRRMIGYTLNVVMLWATSYLAGLCVLYYFPERFALAPKQAGTLIQGLVFCLPIAVVLGYRFLRHHQGFRAFICNVLLGRRLWLGLGLAFHFGIEVLLNVGLFVQVMIAPYAVWLRPQELVGGFRWLASSPLAPGDGRRPKRTGAGQLLRPLDRLRFRRPLPAVTIVHPNNAQAVRQAAYLRTWDAGEVLRFRGEQKLESLHAQVDGQQAPLPSVALTLCRLFPLWMWLPALARVPGCRQVCHRLATWVVTPPKLDIADRAQ